MPIPRSVSTVRRPGFTPFQLGALGAGAATAVEATAISAGAKYGAGVATSAALSAVGAGAAAGSVVPIVGTVVGAVVGLVASKLLNKQYINVAQMDANQDAELAAFNQYKTIMGRAPGRQFGLAAMTAVWKGSLHAGYFPINSRMPPQCFHDGCFKYGGNGSMIDGAINNHCGDGNCFPDLLPRFLAWKSAGGSASASPIARSATIAHVTRGTQLQGLGRASGIVRPMPMMRTLPQEMRPYARRNFAGFGALQGFGTLGVMASAPDAQIFIDQFFIPANSSPSPCSAAGGNGCYWAAPQNSVEHQILYDVADAWLANQNFTTTPFVALQAQAQPPAAVIPAASSTTLPSGTSAIAIQPAPPASAPGQSYVAVPGLQVANVPIGYSGSSLAGSAQGYIRASDANYIMSTAAGSVLASGSTNIIPIFYQAGGNLYNQSATLTVAQLMPYFYPPALAATATPQFPSTNPATASQSGGATTVSAATNANLDAALAAQGFTRIGTTAQGFPVYGQGGSAYLYENGSLFPYGSVSQFASTGNAGTGISTPSTGLDPTIAAAIQSAVAQGMTASQAAQVGASLLSAQGVPVTPTVQDQLTEAATGQPATATSGISPMLLLGGGALLVVLLLRK